jgi:putative hemolysin
MEDADIAARFSFASPDDGPFRRAFIHLIERWTGQPELLRLYLENRKNPVAGEAFFEAAIRKLRMDVSYDADRLAAVPATGPVIFVSNHPYGVLDGLIACALVHRVRPDFKILINAVLTSPSEMQPYALPIDFRLEPDAIETNLRTRAEARKHLGEGGALMIFPSGCVATRVSPFTRKPAGDPAWKPFVSQLIQRSRAPVVPLYFEGENSWAFHAASHLSITLRMALLYREVRNQMGRAMTVRIGEIIPANLLEGLGDRLAIAQHLRSATYAIGERLAPAPYGPRLSRRLGLEVAEEWARLSAPEKLKAAY